MKLKKIFLVIIFNIAILFILLFLIDYGIYAFFAHNFYKVHPKDTLRWDYAHNQWFPDYFFGFENYFNGKNDIFYGRLPDGEQYKDKIPIIIFGCSYAFGEYLNSSQTFSHKLSEQLNRPVYNRSVHGGGFAHMYLQTQDNDIYNKVKNTDTIIYVMINDHYRRTMLQYFDILDYHVYPVIKTKEGKLILTNYKNKFMSFLRSLYITKYLNQIRAMNYVNNPKNAECMTDKAVLFFNQSKKELEKHYGNNFKFYVIFYEDTDVLYSDMLRKKLENNGFKVISTKELTKINLRDEKYFMSDKFHPSEKAWDVLTPLIIEKLGLK